MALRRPWTLVLSIVGCLAAGGIGSFFTSSSIPTWYATLLKPAFSPPNWLFGPVWTILYIMMGVSLYLVLSQKKVSRPAVVLFGIQLFLNTLWSIFFFGLRSPLLGMIDIVLLWAAIAACIVMYWKLSKPAAYLLVPYLLWVSFATVLNYAILTLNP